MKSRIVYGVLALCALSALGALGARYFSPSLYSPNMSDNIQKSDEEWRKQLTAEQFYVTSQKGTETAFTGEFWNHHEAGKYNCVCCGAELFRSEEKFDSGCGWPSFYAAANDEIVDTQTDRSHGMVRDEI